MKRAITVIFELVIEALLLGCFMGLLMSRYVGFQNGMLGSVLAVPVIMALYGYYFVRIASMLTRFLKAQWLYPLAASVAFIGDMWFALWRMKPSLSPTALSLRFPFVIGGICIVSVCAFASVAVMRTRGASSVGGNESESTV
jgi:hypothetical protein